MKIGIYESKSWYLFGIEHQHETPETPYEELHHSTDSQALHAFTILRLPRFGGAREGEIYYSTKGETINGESNLRTLENKPSQAKDIKPRWRRRIVDCGVKMTF